VKSFLIETGNKRMGNMKIILNNEQIKLTVKRMAHQLLENHNGFSDSVIVGLQPRGVFFSNAIVKELQQILPGHLIPYGKLDITFYRDDVRKELHQANKTEMNFSLDGKKLILVDDVLYTGRTIRAALDALQDFGRPGKVELAVLIDRRFSRELPIQPDYAGKQIDAIITQKVKVYWDPAGEKNEVVLE
jgi:pyrimidine operon attenuation protein/uracil phosphoribosyltransferase